MVDKGAQRRIKYKPWGRPWGESNPFKALQPADPWRGLAAAVVIEALKEAGKGQAEAVAWLIEDGLYWLDCLNIYMDRREWESFVKDKIRDREVKRLHHK